MGNKLRAKVEECMDKNERVTFDFKEVEIISHSYADEIFGKLIKKYGISKIKEFTGFINTNELVQSVIINVINGAIQS